MECVALDVEGHHLGIDDFDTLFVGGGVERAFDPQAGLGGRGGNQLDHAHAIDEGAPAPGLRDVAEQAMLDLIPLRGARRIMMDMEPEAGLVGELLQLDLQQPDTRSIRAAAIGRDRQFAGFRVALAPHRVEPAAGGGDGELSRVARDPDAHPPGIGANVVDAIRHDLAEFLVLEVVLLHALRIAFRAIVGASVLMVADQLFLLGVDRNDGLPRRLCGDRLNVDVLELRIAVGMLGALVGLAVRLPTVAEPRQQSLHAAGA
jgi:ribosomal protein S18 acetylase RimI-like enzyme